MTETSTQLSRCSALLCSAVRVRAEWTDPESNNDWDYAITIDCGSKGSRIHIFKCQYNTRAHT